MEIHQMELAQRAQKAAQDKALADAQAAAKIKRDLLK